MGVCVEAIGGEVEGIQSKVCQYFQIFMEVVSAGIHDRNDDAFSGVGIPDVGDVHVAAHRTVLAGVQKVPLIWK